jgi:hypothetical protein
LPLARLTALERSQGDAQTDGRIARGDQQLGFVKKEEKVA